MPNRLIALLAAPAIAFVAGFAGSTQEVGAVDTATSVVPSETMAEGETLYLKNCRMCHGSKGTSGKRLAGNENLADAQYVAGTILVGPGYMTGFAEHLSDEEIALITTYVRNAWGHGYGLVQAAEVAPLR